MLLFVVFTALCVSVYGLSRDATQICLPDVIQFTNYLTRFQQSLTVAYDFPNKKSATLISTEDRQVSDLNDMSTTVINDTDGTCVKHAPEDIVVDHNIQCLPADAVLLTHGPTYLGLHPGGLKVETWRWNLTNSYIATAVITKGTQYTPVLMVITSNGKSSVEILYNSQTSIDDQNIFNVPSVCTPFSPAG